jgi:hypothetical protein
VLQMRVAEPRWILQPKTAHAVHADVRRPNKSVEKQRKVHGQNRISDEDQRTCQRVNDVVDGGADVYSCQIARHRKIGHEQKYCKQEPAEVHFPIAQNADREYQRAFRSKKHHWFCEHSASYHAANFSRSCAAS